jgi:hypothetical protein
MSQEEQLLRKTAEKRCSLKPDKTVRLGDVALRFFTEQVSPKQEKFSAVTEIWNQLLPEELLQHCEIADISAGKLKVRIDSPAYKYELQLCKSELLSELQNQCPKARLTEIKFVLA